MHEHEFRYGVKYALDMAAQYDESAVRMLSIGKPDAAARGSLAAAAERAKAARLRTEYPEWAARLDANAPLVVAHAPPPICLECGNANLRQLHSDGMGCERCVPGVGVTRGGGSGDDYFGGGVDA